MAISGGWISAHTQGQASIDRERPKSGESAKKDLWSSMLDNVASGKRLPEKNILVLGGSSDSQRDFLESLSSESIAKRVQDRHGSRQPPLANNFALGYTYYDVFDADHEDVLARISLYLLAEPSVSFTPLLQPLLTPQTIPNTLVVVLLDWSQPWLWLRQLRDWVRLLRTLFSCLDDRCKKKMAEVMMGWREKGRGAANPDTGGSKTAAEGDITLPLGLGEWDEALGLPLCVVCQNVRIYPIPETLRKYHAKPIDKSDQMEKLEKERAWREEDFDFVLQYLRTVLLKHGASLIYTIPSVPSPLQSLIHSSLGIQSSIKKQPLKHNVIDRDKVVLPPNWDSWGKIRVLREGFDVEGVNNGWSNDIEESLNPNVGTDGQSQKGQQPSKDVVGTIAQYEETIRNPGQDLLADSGIETGDKQVEVQSIESQLFLANQFEVIEKLRKGSKSSITDNKDDNSSRQPSQSGIDINDQRSVVEDGRLNEHIGPVQFNMGGIQVDADDMLQRLRDRQSHQTSPDLQSLASPDGKTQNEALASFFAGLLGRSGGISSGSSKPGTS